MPTPIPPPRSVRWIKIHAKALVRAVNRGDRVAFRRLARFFPDVLAQVAARQRITLAEAQRLLARRYGVATWPQLLRRIEAAASGQETTLSPAVRDALERMDAVKRRVANTPPSDLVFSVGSLMREVRRAQRVLRRLLPRSLRRQLRRTGTIPGWDRDTGMRSLL